MVGSHCNITLSGLNESRCRTDCCVQIAETGDLRQPVLEANVHQRHRQ